MKKKKDSLTISFLPGHNIIVLRKPTDKQSFISTDDSFIIGRDTFIVILNFLVSEGIINYKVLEGILEEYHTE